MFGGWLFCLLVLVAPLFVLCCFVASVCLFVCACCVCFFIFLYVSLLLTDVALFLRSLLLLLFVSFCFCLFLVVVCCFVCFFGLSSWLFADFAFVTFTCEISLFRVFLLFM